MRILLARHGETEWNALGRRQGQLDSPLTALGRRHASQLGSIVDGEPLDLICSSPLRRALDTATPIAERHSMEVLVVDDLAELDHGSFAGLTNEQIESQYPGSLAQRADEKYSWRFPGGESYEDLDIRSASALQAIEETCSKTTLIVSHAMTTRMLLRNLLDLDPHEVLEFNLPHGAVLEVQPDSKTPTRWLSGPLQSGTTAHRPR